MKSVYVHNELIHNLDSPNQIFPHLFKFIQPNSILDVGCGIGTWLDVAKKFNVKEVLGLDGDFVDRQLLSQYISIDEFIPMDLCNSFSLGKRFDLAICLEVAEHLPLTISDILIQNLVNHSDTVLFSAAIPGQGGQNHLNEQWPDFWIKKFDRLGYQVYDPIRPLIWNNTRVDVWYRQNILLFSKKYYPLPKPILTNVVLPEIFDLSVTKNRILEKNIKDIMDGKSGIMFYLKRLFLSIFKFGGRKGR